MITEASPLNFPQDATIDEKNFNLSRTGIRSRRYGMDFETGYLELELGISSVETESVPIRTYLWENVANVPHQAFVIVQVGNQLHVYDNTTDVLSNNFIETISLPLAPNTQLFSFASIDGYLVVATGDSYVSVIEYVSSLTPKFYPVSMKLKVRDLWGIDDPSNQDGNKVSTRPSTGSDIHFYNLRNQSWGVPRLVRGVSDTTIVDPVEQVYIRDSYGKYPSNADIMHDYIKPDPGSSQQKAKFYADEFQEQPPFSSQSPQGYFIIDALERGLDRRLQHELNMAKYPELTIGIDPNNLPLDKTPGGATVVAQFAGRIFYAGFSGEIEDGDNKSPSLSNYILFSRIVDSKSDLIKCYQAGDPTSPDESDLVASDGGFVRVSGINRIFHLEPMGKSLFIFGDNGIWSLDGGDSPFSADNLEINRVSSFSSVNPSSIVVVGDALFYWSAEGIFVLTRNESGHWTSQSITTNTIQSYYDLISIEAKREARGIYDEFNKKVRWIVADSSDSLISAGRVELIFDLELQAFHPFVIEESTNPLVTPKIWDYVTVKNYNTYTFEDGVTASAETVTVNGTTLSVNEIANRTSSTIVKYLTIYLPVLDTLDIYMAMDDIVTEPYQGDVDGEELTFHAFTFNSETAQPEVSTTTYKVGTGSLYIDGTVTGNPWSSSNGRWPLVEIPHRSNGTSRVIPIDKTESWTIEFWVYCSNATAGWNQTIVCQKDYLNSNTDYFRIYVHTTGELGIHHDDGVGGYSTSLLPTNDWAHIAVTYDGATSLIKGYLNGVQEISLDFTPISGFADKSFWMGGKPVGYTGAGGTSTTADRFKGYIDEFIVTREVKYTTTFTPSTQPYIPNLNNTPLNYTFSEYNNEDWLDWYSLDSVGVDAGGYLIPGTLTVQDASRVKQVPYLTWYMLKERSPDTESFYYNGTTLIPKPYNCEASYEFYNTHKGTRLFSVTSSNKTNAHDWNYNELENEFDWTVDGGAFGYITFDTDTTAPAQCIASLNHFRNVDGSTYLGEIIGGDLSYTNWGWLYIDAELKLVQDNTSHAPLVAIGGFRGAGLGLYYDDDYQLRISKLYDPTDATQLPSVTIDASLTFDTWFRVFLAYDFGSGNYVFSYDCPATGDKASGSGFAGYYKNPDSVATSLTGSETQTNGVQCSVINYNDVDYRDEYGMRTVSCGVPLSDTVTSGGAAGLTITQQETLSNGISLEDVINFNVTANNAFLRTTYEYNNYYSLNPIYSFSDDGWLVRDSSCIIRVGWEASELFGSKKTGRPFQAYREVRGKDVGFGTVITRNKIRGDGRTMYIFASTEPGKACNIMGWNYALTGNANV